MFQFRNGLRFDKDGGGAGSGSGSGSTTPPPSTTTETPPEKQSGGKRTFTQADVDRIVQERIAGLNASAQRKLLGKERYELWKGGKAALKDFAVVHTHKVWGPTVQVRNFTEIAEFISASKVTKVSEIGRSIKALNNPRDVIVIGQLPYKIQQHWPLSTTREIVLTGERRQHYLYRHKEMGEYEGVLPKVLADYTDVHINNTDSRMAIFYLEKDALFFFRVAVWISEDSKKKNSVHSFRIARKAEHQSGLKAGKSLTKKPA